MAALDDKSLYEYLVSLRVIDNDLLYKKFEESKSLNKPLQDLLIAGDLIPNESLGQIISEISGFPLARLDKTFISDEILALIPKELAQKYKIIAFAKEDGGISLAMSDPSNETLKGWVAQFLKMPVRPFIDTNKNIDDALDKYSQNVPKILLGALSELPIEEIQSLLFNYAYDNKASDIHIEPHEDFAVVRCRIDGVLHDIISIPKDLHTQLINRIKFLAKLRIDEHTVAQDGKMIFKTKEDLDLRVSILPTILGETLSLRLLSERARQFSLTDLGLSKNELDKIAGAYKSPYGMILSVGPSGSGKTTTLYALIKLLNSRKVKIMTIEDPVEYEIPGVNQIQVNPKTNLTFAEGLKSIARQDPDIILVGEIRDEETAGIAVNSALTGHLVLSTLHANDAATTFPRLFDFKIEPFLISSTINLVIAQRLVRKICSSCRVSLTLETELLKTNFSEADITDVFGNLGQVDVFKGKGCPVCFGTGYVGRVGIFEVLEITEGIRGAINAKKDAQSIRQIAISEGMKTMNMNGLQKAKQGITTIEEVVRTTKE